MINESNYASNETGLESNKIKTKIMSNSAKSPTHLKIILLEYVQKYIYLGIQVSFKKSRHRDELTRQVNIIAWNKFWSFKEIL